MRRPALLLLLALALLLNGCSSGNSEAPANGAAHPAGWLADHAPAAAVSPGYVDCGGCHGAGLNGSEVAPACSSCHVSNTSLSFTRHPTAWSEPLTDHGNDAAQSPEHADCSGCHGADLQGSEAAPDCYGCHAFSTAPPFSIHPATWTEPYEDHRKYAALNGFDDCLPCHGAGLRGILAAPSCFSADVDGRSCHAEGPGQVPHALNGSFLNPANHGPDAEADLASCQSCHAEAGGPGSNPRFNAGIFSAGGRGCESCHGANYAHPQNWAFQGSLVHYSAGNIQESCTLCHGAHLDGEGGIGVSCLTCHVTIDAFTVPHPMDGSFLAPAAHGPVAKQDLTFCQGCHSDQPDGGPGSNPRFKVGIDSEGGHGCESCHGQNYAHPSNWAGPNTTFHYSAMNVNVACTPCHGENLDGDGGVGVSCLDCHDSVTDFTLDCSACHGYPPDGSADVASTTGVDHLVFAETGFSFHTDCQFCHGMKESDQGGHFADRSNYKLFDKTTDTPGDHWDGNINMNSWTEPVYDETSFGCTECHAADPAHQVPRSGLPVNSQDYND